MKSATTPRRPSKGERTRIEILAAAERCFGERGFRETRLDDIGAEIGIAGTAILYHFKDKRTLFHEVVDDVVSEFLEGLRMPLAGSGPLPDRVEAMIGNLVDYSARRPAAIRIAMREASTADPQARAILRARSEPLFAVIADIFEEGRRTGAIDPLRSDPLHFVSAVMGTVMFYVAALPTFVEDLPADHLAPEHIDALKRDVTHIARRLLGISGPRSSDAERRSRHEDRAGSRHD